MTKRGKFFIVLAVVIFCCSQVITGVELRTVIRAQARQQTIQLLQEDAITECQRVQVLRTEVNSNSRVIHDVLQAVGQQSLQSSIFADHQTAKIYLLYASQQHYHPPTNCVLAIHEGKRYHRPPDQPFPDVTIP